MRIKKYSIVILFLFVSLYIKATGQSCDVIYINGEQWWLMSRPIDKDSALYARLRVLSSEKSLYVNRQLGWLYGLLENRGQLPLPATYGNMRI